MADKALKVYLNDHLAGSTFGADLAERLAERMGGAAMQEVAQEIKEDRRTLLSLMDRLQAPRNPVKQAMTWLAEKISHVKLSGLSGGDPEYGLFMALETLSLGVEGKAAMWGALADAVDRRPELSELDLERLHARAMHQRKVIEAQRLATGRRAFTGAAG